MMQSKSMSSRLVLSLPKDDFERFFDTKIEYKMNLDTPTRLKPQTD